VWHDKDHSLLKGAEHGPKFAALSPVMVTAARWLKNCSCGYKKTKNE
jgi:hypothetical protein